MTDASTTGTNDSDRKKDIGTEKRQESQAGIGARLRQARELVGLSQGQVAKIMNMHRPTISEIEAGRRRVSADELSQFAEKYDVSISWLAEGATENDVAKMRYELAARELAKLKPDDVERLLNLLAVLKKSDGGRD